jgi:signal transduction histidine kinase/ActR/RegA family two-component response regulator
MITPPSLPGAPSEPPFDPTPDFLAEGEPGGMRVRWFDLAFIGPSASLETPFRDHYARQSVGQLRLASVLGFILIAGFGALDAFLLPEAYLSMWTIRFGVMAPLPLLLLAGTYRESTLRFLQPLVGLFVVLCGLGITAMVVLAPPPVNYSYYAGNILVILYGYTFLRLRFAWASLAGWIVVALYQVAAIGLSDTPLAILANNDFFFVSANLIGMVACYSAEYHARRDFYMMFALSEQRARLATVRDDLERRVIERTRALTRSNEELNAEVVHRRVAEAEREALQGRLAQAQRMEAIGNLAAGVAHDLNNILSGLVGWPELVLMDLEPESPLREPVETIKQSGERAAAVVQDLLTLARRGAQVKEAADLSELAGAELASPSFRKTRRDHPHVTVHADLHPDLLPVVGSPVHLSKCIANLLSNACEANMVEGSVTVRTENRFLEEPLDGYQHIPAGEYVVLSVRDTGVGISTEDLDQIFEPFYTKKRMGRSGTGLGMTVVWTTVQEHGGFLDVRTCEGEGTTFEIFLPAARDAVAETRVRRALDELRGHERILIVDDLESQRDIAGKMLGKLGYEVSAVATGEDAVAWIAEQRADLVILDMMMDPGIDGCETYRRMLDRCPGQRAIIASGYAENERAREVQALGAGSYVRKPFTMDQLASAVRAELDRVRPDVPV